MFYVESATSLHETICELKVCKTEFLLCINIVREGAFLFAVKQHRTHENNSFIACYIAHQPLLHLCIVAFEFKLEQIETFMSIGYRKSVSRFACISDKVMILKTQEKLNLTALYLKEFKGDGL